MLNFDIQKQLPHLKLRYRAIIDEGKIVAVVGPSGSGKSTLLRLLAGLERPDNGEIYYNDRPWFKAQNKLCVEPQKRGIGFVFQDYALFEHMTVEQNITFSLSGEQTASDWLARFELSDYANVYPSQLSGGQKQRLALARALATNPRLLLLDEPLSAIDFSLRRGIRRDLKNILKQWNRTSIVVTHDLEEAQYIADEIILLNDGNILQTGPAEVVFSNPISIRAGQLLGWHNQLAVEKIENGIAVGSFGSVYIKTNPRGEKCDLLFRDDDVEVAKSETQDTDFIISGIALQNNMLGLEVQTKDGILIEARLPLESGDFHVGERVTLRLKRCLVYPDKKAR